jgi:hypothetical protein
VTIWHGRGSGTAYIEVVSGLRVCLFDCQCRPMRQHLLFHVGRVEVRAGQALQRAEKA